MTTPLFELLTRNLACTDDDIPEKTAPAVPALRIKRPVRPEMLAAHRLAVEMMDENSGLSRFMACKAAARKAGVNPASLYGSWKTYAERIKSQEVQNGI